MSPPPLPRRVRSSYDLLLTSPARRTPLGEPTKTRLRRLCVSIVETINESSEYVGLYPPCFLPE